MTIEQKIDSVILSAHKKITRLIDNAIDKSCYIIHNSGQKTAFNLSKNAQLDSAVKKIFDQAAAKIHDIITDSVKTSWQLGDGEVNNLLTTFTKGLKIPDQLKSKIFRSTEKELTSYLGRTVNGSKLSDRVWNITDTAYEELNLLMDEGLTVGKSAAELSRDVRTILNDPNKLFRRVRDENGNLQLSRAAKNYHPGQGQYRSAYKNALRLTGSEVNMSYEMAEHARYQQVEFILGFEVVLSNNHPEYDICDELAGKYPKEFIFRKWHPKCRCHKEAILPTEKEFLQYLDDGSLPGKVDGIPKQASEYVKNNAETFDGWKNRPYWADDNFTKEWKLDI